MTISREEQICDKIKEVLCMKTRKIGKYLMICPTFRTIPFKECDREQKLSYCTVCTKINEIKNKEQL